MPDIRTAALTAKRLRDTIMSGYGKAGLGDAIPPLVSGHAPDGRPSSEPHLALAPMAFLGWPYASGTVLGFALIPPRHSQLWNDPSFQQAFRAVLHLDAKTGRRGLRVEGGGVRLALAPGASERRSLDRARYCQRSRIWASATPIVLDRYLKATTKDAREEEIGKQLAQACGNIGLPAPIRVAAGKHPAIEGTPSAYPSGKMARWMRWRVADSLATRPLVHAVIEFAEPVRGPVILGAGRFLGLGLCLPLNHERRPHR
jgi:CRISPR-associated protein Csb2